VYRRLGDAALTTGEKIELGVVEAPDAEWADRLVPFLIHKGGDWNYHVKAALTRPLDGLETRFYVGHLDGQPITQVMIVGARGVGILAHVFTAPGWRQRGAYRQLMAAQMADCRRLGFKILTLSTGFNSHPYWIYHSFGFRSMADGSGDMCWLADPDAGSRFLAPADANVHPLDWSDWAAYSFATLQPVTPDDVLPRSPALDIRGQDSVEGPFITFRRTLDGIPGAQSRVLRSVTGAVVGWCHVMPGPVALGDAWLLDWNTLPHFESHRATLLDGLTWPDAPVAFLATAADPASERILSRHGFQRLATFPGFIALSARKDLGVWVRK
jgi:GNAT superfamily N-acetyltransferase